MQELKTHKFPIGLTAALLAFAPESNAQELVVNGEFNIVNWTPNGTYPHIGWTRRQDDFPLAVPLKTGWTGMRIQSRSAEATGWTGLGHDLYSLFADTRPLAAPATPEVREYAPAISTKIHPP